ncbi:MAG: toll/interleukin-1 receptor domain-containing protein, partial [Bradyrhizobium sp.]|nr:toll/interleukin-1 receptor domain-containing protein [Bradyrhizobium sp.]
MRDILLSRVSRVKSVGRWLQSVLASLSLERMRDLVFGYDLFISYDFDEAGDYATKLKRRLEELERPVRCFLDRDGGFHPSDDLKVASRRRIRMAQYLVAILTPGVGQPLSWVPRELELFTRGGKKYRDRLVPLNVQNSLQAFPPGAGVRTYLPFTPGPDGGSSILFQAVSAEEFADGPSASTIARIVGMMGARRVDRTRLRFFKAATAVLASLFLATLALFLVAEDRRQALAETFSQTMLRGGASLLDYGNVPGAVANIARALDANPNNISAGDRLYSLLLQRPTPWRKVDQFKPGVRIVAGAQTDDARLVALALANGTVLIGTWPGKLLEAAGDRCSYREGDELKLGFASDGKVLAAWRNDGELCAWDVATRQLLDPFEGTAKVTAFAISRDSQRIVVGFEDGSAIMKPLKGGKAQTMPALIRAPSGSETYTTEEETDTTESIDPNDEKPPEKTVSNLQFVANDNKVVVAREDGVLVWNLGSDTVTELFVNEPANENRQIGDTFVRASPDGRW